MARAFFTLPGASGNYISTPNTADLDIINSIAMVAQVRVSNAASGNLSVIETRQTNSGYQLAIDTSTSRLFARHGDGATDRVGDGSPLVVTPATIRTISGRFDATAGDWLFNVNGVEEPDALGNPGVASATGTELAIGAVPGGASIPFEGDIMYAQVVDGYLPIGPVAHMNANEAGFAGGAIPNGSTWTGDDGRVWTVNGTGITYTPASGGLGGDMSIIRENRRGMRALAYGGQSTQMAFIRYGRTI